jgi:hypothetical protein
MGRPCLPGRIGIGYSLRLGGNVGIVGSWARYNLYRAHTLRFLRDGGIEGMLSVDMERLALGGSGQLFEQRPGLLQIGGVKAFGEPAVDLGERLTRFAQPALRLPQAT